jgi:hypothetical protein
MIMRKKMKNKHLEKNNLKYNFFIKNLPVNPKVLIISKQESI